MVDGIPEVFRSGGSDQIVSYGAIDIIEGVSFVKFYGGGTGLSGSNLYRLSRNSFNVNHISSIAGVDIANGVASYQFPASGDNTKGIDLDFDTSVINIPTTLKGTMLSVIPFATYMGGNSKYYVQGVVDLKRVDVNNVETTIVRTAGNVMEINNDQATNTYMTIESLVPLTIFKKGEKIRITIEVWGDYVSGGNVLDLNVLYDPSGTSLNPGSTTKPVTDTGFSVMYHYLPFKTDL